MTNIRARNLWNQQLGIRVAGRNLNASVAVGVIKVQFIGKFFPAEGPRVVAEGRVRKAGQNIEGRLPNSVLTPETSGRLQVYWKFQYDLDIGGLYRLRRLRNIGGLGDSKVKGLSNIIQSFDVVPGRRPRSPHTITYRMVRGDNRNQSVAPWEWDFAHSRTVRGGSVNTVTTARLPISYSGSLTYEASMTVSGEMGWSLGPELTGGAGVTAGGGASINVDYRRTLQTRLMGFVNFSLEEDSRVTLG